MSDKTEAMCRELISAIREEVLIELAEHYQIKADASPRYTPVKGGTTSRAVFQAVADELSRMVDES